MKLLILDGNSVINRAYYGVKPLTTRDGLFTHAIYGFLNILDRMEKEEQPEAICVAFDLKGPTFRHLQYDGYKATRHGMPEELAAQMPIMKEVLTAMNIPIYTCEGWEADDIIGLPALGGVDGDIHGGKDFLHDGHLLCQLLGHPVPGGFVAVVLEVSEGGALQIEGHTDGLGLLFLLHTVENVQKTVDRVGKQAVPGGQRFDTVVGPVDDRVSVKDQ